MLVYKTLYGNVIQRDFKPKQPEIQYWAPALMIARNHFDSAAAYRTLIDVEFTLVFVNIVL